MRIRHVAAIFGLLGVLLLALSTASAQTTDIAPRDALGPYNWTGDHPGRWNTGQFLRFMWFWQPLEFTELVHEVVLPVTGTPDGELLDYYVEALPEVISTTDDLVDPRGMAVFGEGELWIADYGADKIVAYDPTTGEFRTVFEHAEMDGPIDIDCMTYMDTSGRSSGWGPSGPILPTCGYDGLPDCPVYGVCAVVTVESNKIILFDQDGEFQVSDDITNANGVEFVGSDYSGQWAGVFTDHDLVGWRVRNNGDDGWSWMTNLYGISKRNFCRGFDDISAVLPLSGALDEDLLIVDRGADAVYYCEEEGWSSWGTNSLVWDSEDGLNAPVDIAKSSSMRHVNFDYGSVAPWNSSVTGTYVLNGDGSIVRFSTSPVSRYTPSPGCDETYRLFSDAPELQSVQSMRFYDPHRGAYVLTSNAETGGTSLLSFPWYVGVKIEAIGAPADAHIGVGRETAQFNSYLRWMWADGSNDHEITFNATREENLSIFVGRARNTEAAGFNMLATETLVPDLAGPTTTATPGGEGGKISLEITHPTDIDELRLYTYTGCENLQYWGSGYAYYVCPEDCDARMEFECEGFCGTVYTDPPDGAHEVLFPDLFDCFTQIDEIAPDPSGTTQYEVTDYVPGMEYCFVSMAVDNSGNRFSRPSDIDFLQSCAVTPAGSAVGLVCSDSLEAVSSTETEIFQLPTGAPGNPTWYSYTVPGQLGEEHVISATIDSVIESGGTSMIRVFIDDCPEASQIADVAGERSVGLVASGGDEIFFELSYFGRRSMSWHLEDLQFAPVSQQLRPTDVVATGGDAGDAQDGQITVCWEPVIEAGFRFVNYDFVHYEVWRGPEGGPANTMLVDDWQGHCYVDTDLGPSVTYEYEIVAIYPLYYDAPYHGSIDDVAVIRSETSRYAPGMTSATDVTGAPPSLAPPAGLNVNMPDPRALNYLAPLTSDSWYSIGRSQSIGTRIWWDKAFGPTRHRIVQHDMGTGETTEYVVPDQTHAVDLRMDRMSLLCFDVIAERENEDGLQL